MQCPNCNINLVLADRQDVEIYFCQQCRGIWLDRGKLDKIFERFSNPQRREQDVARQSHDKQTGDSDNALRKRRN